MAGVVLTEQMILNKTKVSSLAEVRNLNLWGVGLSDVSVVSKLESIQVLALAANNISSLKCFAGCATLEELYLRKNNVSQLKEVVALKGLKKLHTLWLVDNPCAKHPLYREFVLHCCANLKQLDSVEVTAEERATASKKVTAKVIEEIVGKATTSTSSNTASSKVSPGATPVAAESSEGATPFASPRGSRNSFMEERNANGKTVLYTTVQAQRAMLTAIASLLPELSVESLEFLEREVHVRVEKQKQQLSRMSQGETGGSK